jgi:transposase-like protein
MRKPRKNYTAEEKVTILRRHLLDKVPVSEICEEYQLQPNLFYQWQKQFFENGAAAFQNRSRDMGHEQQERIAALEQKLQTKNEVLSELMEEHVALKKSLGEI